MKAVPYIETVGNVAFKNFMTQPFHLDLLDNNSNDPLFTGWIWEKKGKFDIFVKDKTTMYFFEDKYKIVSTEDVVGTFELPLPETVDNFVSDFVRMKIPLEWNPKIREMFRPQDYLPENQLENYYKRLLDSLGKGHELLTDDDTQ